MFYFILPAYNEEKNILSLLESIGKKTMLLKSHYKIIVINDGSTDATRQIVEAQKERFPITLLNHDTNKNVGQVFRTAFQHVLAEAKEDDLIITKESDNTSDLNILDGMLKKIDEGNDLVLASCYAKGGKIIGTTIDRIFLSSVANLMLRIFFPIKGVRTYSSFYRVYRAGALRKAFQAYDNNIIEESGFACMVEILVKLSRLPVKIAEVPMVLRCDLRQGKSKMNKVETIRAYFHLIVKEFKNRFKGI